MRFSSLSFHIFASQRYLLLATCVLIYETGFLLHKHFFLLQRTSKHGRHKIAVAEKWNRGLPYEILLIDNMTEFAICLS
jgi:hypothetical protein